MNITFHSINSGFDLSVDLDSCLSPTFFTSKLNPVKFLQIQLVRLYVYDSFCRRLQLSLQLSKDSMYFCGSHNSTLPILQLNNEECHRESVSLRSVDLCFTEELV